MQVVNVNSAKMSGSWLLISSIEELNKYSEHTQSKVSDLITSLIRDRVPVDRWDHCITQDPAGSVLATTLVTCQFKGLSPVFEIDKVMFKKFLNMAKYIANGRKVLVNRLGGYCPAPEDATFEFEEEIDLSFVPTYFINENTKYINLENDPKLEKYSENYLKDKDVNYSYITNLSSHTNNQLKAIFKEFISKGGTTVYVYTTGMKIQQMYDYFNTAVDTGLSSFEFEFNSEITTDIKLFIDYAKERAKLTYNF